MTRLQHNYQSVLDEIALVEHEAGRFSGSVQLIAVSKTFSTTDIREVYAAGQRDFGENYIQEWFEKTDELADLPNIIWHIIGNVQSNKTKFLAECAHWVHTIDSVKVARRLSEQRPATVPPLQVCIEVNIAAESNKHGVAPDAVLALVQQVTQLPNLTVRGLMCVPQAGAPDNILRQQFSQVQTLLVTCQNQGFPLDVLSMGMSADMDTAIACGSTHVRVGSAIFGKRDNTIK